jgi:hypothetical protein
MGTSTFNFYSSINAYTTGGAGVYLESGTHFDPQYSDSFSNTGGSYSGVSDPTGTNGNDDSDPGFTSWTNNSTDDDDFALVSASALVNAGNPSSTYNDTDGTRNDMGAYGGPGGAW